MPLKNLFFLSISHLEFSSLNGNEFGLSPYTLFVDKKIKGALYEYFLVKSKRLRVPKAFILKSTNQIHINP